MFCFIKDPLITYGLILFAGVVLVGFILLLIKANRLWYRFKKIDIEVKKPYYLMLIKITCYSALLASVVYLYTYWFEGR